MPKIGQTTTCYCGKEIVWLGRYWDHVGTKYRHIARPKDTNLFSGSQDEAVDGNDNEGGEGNGEVHVQM